MMTPAKFDNTTRLEAAQLAFAMLRFGDGAAHPWLGAGPPGAPEIGVDAFVFMPSWRQVPRDAVAGKLADLPCPAVLACSTTRGVYTLMLLDELQDERRRGAVHELDNAVAFMRAAGDQLKLTPTSRIILQFDEEELIFSYAVLLALAALYGINVGANLRSYTDDSRAQARLMLFRSDGRQSWGGSCPIPEGPRGDGPPAT